MPDGTYDIALDSGSFKTDEAGNLVAKGDVRRNMVYSDDYVSSLQIGDVINAGNWGKVTVEKLERSDYDEYSEISISIDDTEPYYLGRGNGDTGWVLTCHDMVCKYTEKSVTVVIASNTTTEDWYTPFSNGTGSEPIQATGAKTVEEFFQKHHFSSYTPRITVKDGMVTNVVFYYVTI